MTAAKILFVSDFQRINCAAEHAALGEALMKLLQSGIRQAGLLPTDYDIVCLHPRTPRGGKDVWKLPAAERDADVDAFKVMLAAHPAAVIVPMGEYVLETLCGISGISKWHCSLTRLKAEYGGRKAVPLLHPDHVSRNFSDSFYLAVGIKKAVSEMNNDVVAVERTFKLCMDYGTAMEALEEIQGADRFDLDLEFGSGQINTVGFATSPTNAIAIRTLPDYFQPAQHHELWKKIAGICENDKPKAAQHFITEATWLARYGIELRGIDFDTMWAQKFLHPEFDKGLDNVGRLYTSFPYWKDDNDEWANIRDWPRHLRYNCCDTTGTAAARLNQIAALKERGLYDLFQNFVMQFAPVIQEMCVRGLRVDVDALGRHRDKLVTSHENFTRILEQEFTTRLGRSVNPRSPKQLQKALKELGMKLPTKYSKSKDEQSETTDKKALVKLRRKHKDEPVLPALIGLSATNKQLSSYIDFEYDRRTSRVHYTLDGCGTETGRWAGYNSGWGEGFNPQTVPKAVRNCFVADAGRVLVQIDLAQAESRYVAWESPEPRLMEMLSEGRDVHKYVAGKIFNKPEDIVTKLERQLGKKSGHSANYSVGPRTFAEACLVEMNHYVTEDEAKRIIETYFEVFPGVRTRQANIRKVLQQKRLLKTPIGRERYFYGYMNDATYREAYAYAPQSVIPDITNHLMLKLWKERDYIGLARDEGNWFLLQVHDSLLLECDPARVQDIADLARDLKAWHPRITLPGGELWIPVEVEAGPDWKNMENV